MIAAAPPRVPAGRRIYAIGDIHGRVDLLGELLERIAGDAQGRGEGANVLVFLGDYVDRGADSRAVIDRLAAGPLPGFACHCLIGNHESMMLDFLEGGERDLTWLANGGLETLASFDIFPRREGGTPPAWDLAGLDPARRRLAEALAGRRLAFLRGLASSHREGDYLFVHAGIRPGVAIADQSADDMMWIRGAFLRASEPHPLFVVHGHCITDSPDVQSNRIGIDTGAYRTGVLTALVLDGAERAFLAT